MTANITRTIEEMKEEAKQQEKIEIAIRKNKSVKATIILSRLILEHSST
ncbi:MAG: hypothetical protein ACRCWY_01745 [Cellulosilyticaceae bacterium]